MDDLAVPCAQMDVFAEADEVTSAARLAVKLRSSDASLATETPSDSPTSVTGTVVYVGS